MGRLGYEAAASGGDVPAPVGSWPVPLGIKLVDGHLTWPRQGRLEPLKEAGPKLGWLKQFVRLREGDADAILTFAKRWGVLDLCLHGIPASHAPERAVINAFVASGIGASGVPPVESCRGSTLFGHSESVDRWRHFAAEAHAMLSVAASLHRGEPAPPETWRPLETLLGAPAENVLGTGTKTRLDSSDPGRGEPLDHLDRVAVPSVGRRLKSQWSLLGSLVQTWQEIGDVRVILNSERFTRHVKSDDVEHFEGPPTLEFGSTSMFGALALQLALAVFRSEGVAICTNCTDPYVPSRKPRAGERTYCEECGAKAARRDGARRSRAKKREAAAEVDR